MLTAHPIYPSDEARGQHDGKHFWPHSSSVSTKSDSFKQIIRSLMDDPNSPASEEEAHHLIKMLSHSKMYNQPLCDDEGIKSGIKLHCILEAMLHYSEDCGGKQGKHYIVCGVCACGTRGSQVLQYLQDYATTLLSHLLFVFKANSSYHLRNRFPSQIATLAVWDVVTSIDEETINPHLSSFRTQLLKRDGFQCAATGHLDADHPHVPPEAEDSIVTLEACHILCRAIAEFEYGNSQSKSYQSALTTFDILCHYANLPVTTIGDIGKVIDEPCNGFMLQSDAYNGFDNFRWSLKPTANPNVYDILYHKRNHGLLHHPSTLSFSDWSQQGIALPNPAFICIHSAIAGILHMSGAGEVIDNALDRYDLGDSRVILTGDDFVNLGQQ